MEKKLDQIKKKLDQITDILSETEDLKEAMALAVGALATVIAQGDPKLDREAYEFVKLSLDKLIPEYRKEMEDEEKKAKEIVEEVNRQLCDPSIPIEEIADKFCDCKTPELRASLIERMTKMREERLK